MAYTGIMASEVQIKEKAGTGANATATGEIYLSNFAAQAESFINVATGFNWCDSFATINNDFKRILIEATSNLAAVYVINWDMSGYTSRIEAEDMVNILLYRFNECIKVLKEVGTKRFMGVED